MSNMSYTKTIKLASFLKDILYIPVDCVCERIDLTDDLQLPSNHNGSFTNIILQGQNIDGI